MKKFFKNKINIFLLFVIITAGAFAVLKDVYASDTNAESSLYEFSDIDVQTVLDNNAAYNLFLRDGGVSNFPGYTDPEDYPRDACFEYMGPVDFTSEWRYRTNDPNLNSDGQNNRLHSFTIPLVADLDGDGHPEVIGIQQRDNDALSGEFTGISVFNGQSGTLISKNVRFKTSTGVEITNHFTHGGVHTSPSLMCLVDSDRDGIVELIIGFPSGGGNSNYRNKLVSYDIIPTKTNGVTTAYSLQYRWESSSNYNSDLNSNCDKPVPTIVDLDGDGVPEVLVYNKVYNAVNGSLLLTFEPGTGQAAAKRSTAYIGCDDRGYSEDKYIGFNYVYDIDLDGIYDVIAGGKVYRIKKTGTAFSYDLIQMTGVIDGRTGVADINGDGIPDVVSIVRSSVNDLTVSVWNPGFHKIDNGNIVSDNPNGNPSLMTQRTFRFPEGSVGTTSYVYIGDIDGRVQTVDGQAYRLPEIAILGGSYNYNHTSKLTKHPNVSSININNGGLPSQNSEATSSRKGDLIALTWDAANGVTTAERLKLSFALEHEDASASTGFTMFDFDNDGEQEICYRDEKTLRIIKPSQRPYVSLARDINDGTNSIVFKKTVTSRTGYEYPAIADVDNDASAEMIVMGHNSDGMSSSGGTPSDAYTRGYVTVVGNGSGDKFAPALPVWNQFMYDPFKINEDLTTPTGPAQNRLSYSFTKPIRNNNGEIINVIENYNPFNGTLIQMSRYQVITGSFGGQEYTDLIEPVVFLQDAYFVTSGDDAAKKPVLVYENNKNYIKVWVGNKDSVKTDVSVNMPITIYKDSVSIGSLYKTVTLYECGILSPIKAGEEIELAIEVDNLAGYYILRLGDCTANNSNVWSYGVNAPNYVNNNLKIGTAKRANRDCYWADNVAEVSNFLPVDDAATVVQYESILIDVLKNDFLEICSTPVLLPENITTPAGVGVMSGDFGSLEIVDNKLMYTAPQTYPGNVVELSYSLTCSSITKAADVYIYIIESCSSGFAACEGTQYDVCIKESPTGITFKWQDQNHVALDNTPSIPVLTTDVEFYVKPNFGDITDSPYMTIDFPMAKLTIRALSSTDPMQMKWTGDVDTDWNNPNNWVQVLSNGTEYPVFWAPTSCANVTIPSVVTNYPELTAAANCGTIHLADRAMISGIHWLTYESASVDFKPLPSEKDRFVMWSAPLKDMYTGDYHFLNASNAPDWGHVYMNFFQSANPDYASSVETEKTFTATFGSTGTTLPLGKAFNVKVMSGREDSFTFPKTATSYTDANGNNSGTLSRTNSGRFITDGVLQGDGSMALPVEGNNSFKFIQVVNPFMGYLKISDFLTANSTSISSTFYLWNGDVNANFITVLPYADNDEMRYEIDESYMSGSTIQYIAPLQSFFVAKQTATDVIATLNMNASMVTTKIPGQDESYVLKSAARGEDSESLLRVTASVGDVANSTVLLRRSGAQPEFNEGEDAGKFFNHGVPVSVYTIDANQAVAINVSENFEETMPLGIRLTDTSNPVTLSFTGIGTFGQDVYLIDHAMNDKEIDLQQQDSYVFTVASEGGKEVTELNNRFSLRFGEVPTGMTTIDNEIRVRTVDGGIDVSCSTVFDRVEVINMLGMKVYDNMIPTLYRKVPLTSGQVYIVRITMDNRLTVKKVLVK